MKTKIIALLLFMPSWVIAVYGLVTDNIYVFVIGSMLTCLFYLLNISE